MILKCYSLYEKGLKPWKRPCLALAVWRGRYVPKMKPAAFSSPFGSLIFGFSTHVDDPRILWLVLPQVVQKSCWKPTDGSVRSLKRVANTQFSERYSILCSLFKRLRGDILKNWKGGGVECRREKGGRRLARERGDKGPYNSPISTCCRTAALCGWGKASGPSLSPAGIAVGPTWGWETLEQGGLCSLRDELRVTFWSWRWK